MFIKCPNCDGKGYTPYVHIKNGICFSCNGKGKIKHAPNQKRVNYLKESIQAMTIELKEKNESFLNGIQSTSLMDESQEKQKRISELNKLAKKIFELEKKINDFKEALNKELSGDDQ